MIKDTGGWAFPSHGTMGEVIWEGMTLRDYFAAHASDSDVAGALEDLGRSGSLKYTISHPRQVAIARFAVADAMLKARGE